MLHPTPTSSTASSRGPTCAAAAPILAVLATAFFLSACAGTERIAESERPPALPETHALIPAPVMAELDYASRFVFTDSTQIVVDAADAEARRIGRFLSELIGHSVETMPEVVDAGTEHVGRHVRLRIGGAGSSIAAEGYVLEIRPEAVTITAADHAGLFYGVQTIRQLLPWYVEYEAAFPQAMWLPVGRIADEPRFAWRGAMLDVARHFLPAQHVKRYIDLMALHKLNRLHLHLSDDQGWRIEVPGRPRLTNHGGHGEVGGREGGYYTTDEYQELVRYAQARFVTVVPEIDMPGHTNAALSSYAELNCDDRARDPYIGTSVGFSYLCVEKEETYAFVDEVVGEIAAMTPGPYFHLGGDEVHELTGEQYVQFMERAQEIVAKHGKRVVGWDEIAEADLDLIPGTIVQVWRPQTPATADKVAEAVAAGAHVVLSPADRIYIDMKYDSTTVLGLAWAGFNDVRDAYDWEPAALNPDLPESSILGVEAPLWSETLRSMADFEYMAFPRLAGVAELGWSPVAARSWESFRRRVGRQASRWTALGINFYRAPEIPWE